MKKSISILAAIIFIAINVGGQVSLTPSVISIPAADMPSQGISASSWTLGELAVTTLNGR